MKLKKTLKYAVPTVGVVALAVALPLALTSCSNSNDFDSITVDGKKLTAKNVLWSVPKNTTYWVSSVNKQYPILNGSIDFINTSISTQNVNITYQWYKNSAAIQGSGANSSQYVVTDVSKSGDNYFCVARISNPSSNSTKQLVVTSPLYTVTNSPLSAKIQYNDPVRGKYNFIGQVDGYNSQLKVDVSSTSADFNMQQELQNGNITFKWYKRGLFGNKLMSQMAVFEPTEPGVYFCEATVIKNGQYVTVQTGPELIEANQIKSSLSESGGQADGNTYYLNKSGGSLQDITITPKFESYKGQQPSAITSGVYATMWLKKEGIGIYSTSNNNNNEYKVIPDYEMKAGANALKTATPGEYMLVEAMYPQGTGTGSKANDFSNYNIIENLKYTPITIAETKDITNVVESALENPTNVAKVQKIIFNVDKLTTFTDTSVAHTKLVNDVLDALGLQDVATVTFTPGPNPGNPSTNPSTKQNKDTELQPASNYTVTVNIQPKVGYSLSKTQQLTDIETSIQGTTVIKGFKTKIDSLKEQLTQSLNKKTFNNAKGEKEWLNSANTADGEIYKSIVNVVLGNSSSQPSQKEDTIPANSFIPKVTLGENPGKDEQFSATITFEAAPGYSFDDDTTTSYSIKIEKISSTGYAVNPVNTTVATAVSNLPTLIGLMEKINNPAVQTVAKILKYVDNNQYILSTSLFTNILEMILGLKDKVEPNPTIQWQKQGKTYNLVYTFTTKDEKKWMFPSSPLLPNNLNSKTYKFTLRTGITELQDNHNNGLISNISLTSDASQTVDNGSKVSLGISTKIAGPAILDKFLKLNYQWEESASSAAKDQSWNNVSNNATATTPTLVINSISTNTQYRCKVWITLMGKQIGAELYSPIYTITVSSSSTGTGSGTEGSEGSTSGSTNTGGSSSNGESGSSGSTQTTPESPSRNGK